MEHVAAGDRAFVDEEYGEAVNSYTAALAPGADLGSHAPSRVYEARAFARIKLQQWVEAVQDAAKAIELDAANAKAYLRKGTACFHLEEFESALEAFKAGQALAPDMSQFRGWVAKCEAALAGEGQPAAAAAAAAPPAATQAAAAPAATAAAAAPAAAAAAAAAGAAATAAAEPPTPAQVPAAPQPTPAAAAPAAANGASSSGAADADAASKALAPAAPDAFGGKYRHQWYQLGPKVVIDIYAKNLPKDAVTARLSGPTNSHLVITITAAAAAAAAQQQAQQQQQQPEAQEEEDYVFDVELFGPVAAEQPPRVEVLRTKVEVTLLKAQPNASWRSLEATGSGPAPAGVAAAAVGGSAGAAPRTYPSSSSKGPKDWSKVEAEVKQLEEKGELDDGDPLNSFFKKIFAQGDDDTRRAMMKSFVESNGTVLSTNWQEVGAKKIECTPPEGMELHKWSE